MLIDILNFVFVYFISGFILSLFIKRFTKKAFDNKLTFLVGYGIAPLLISLILYYLYLFFPGKEWSFYALTIYTIFIIFFVFSIKEINKIKFKEIYSNIKNIFKKTLQLDIFKKILLSFILFVIIFNLIANIFYRTQWVDAFKYLKQGFVYSQDRSLDRLKTRKPFSEFGKNNRLNGPEEKYIMNLAIRPAIPIFYSFFYKNKIPANLDFTSIRFIYFYYFLLSILIIAYILSRYKKKQFLTGLTIFLSCYFVTRFSFVNYKETILIFYSVLSLYLLYILNKQTKYFYVVTVLLGSLCGIMSYINYSGSIITGILFILGLFYFKSTFKKKILAISIIFFAFIVFSGGEFLQYKNFILNKNLISIKNQEKTFNSKELKSYKIDEGKEINKLDILIRGKLQGFTQIQFFGFIYPFFLLILFLVLIKRKKMDLLSKLHLSFITIFFFVIMDPLFLNPHKYAYVLSISHKYTVLLVPFLVIFIVLNYEVFLNLIKKIKLKYLKFILIFSLLLITPIRKSANERIFDFFGNVVPLYNSHTYYIEKINIIMFTLSLISLIIFILTLSLKKKYYSVSLINTMFLSVFFIIPFLFFLNNNQDIFNTFLHATDKNITRKLENVTKAKKSKQIFKIVNFINTNINDQAIICIDTQKIGSNRYNFWYYTKNNQRLIPLQSCKNNNVNINYILTTTKDNPSITLYKLKR